MESIAEVVLLKSEELTSGGGKSLGQLIFTGEGNGLENILGTAFCKLSKIIEDKLLDSRVHTSDARLIKANHAMPRHRARSMHHCIIAMLRRRARSPRLNTTVMPRRRVIENLRICK